MAEYYKMPVTGKTTTDFDEYFKAWHDLALPVENAFDVKLAGYGSDFLFMDNFGQTVTLPVWFVKRFKENYK